MSALSASASTPNVLIVGAGFVGSIVTHLLRERGLRVRTFDQARVYPDAFRAEKLEPDQSQLLAGLGLLQRISPPDTVIDRVLTFTDGRVRQRDYDGQYGIRYADTVNSLRQLAAAKACIDDQRVVALEARDGLGVVHTADGTAHRAALCIVASGNCMLLRQAGIGVEVDPSLTSLTFGFDVARRDASRTPLRPFNYHSHRPDRNQVHYVTLFPIGGSFRANVFTTWSPQDPRVREFVERPDSTMLTLFPRLRELTGELVCTTRVQVARTSYHRVAPPTVGGIVVLGEAYQSVSPATGMGLSKCLTDVHVLMRHLPGWMGGHLVTAAQIAAFYRDPQKARVDDEARDCWRWYDDRVSGRSLRSRLRRGLAARAAARIASLARKASALALRRRQM